MKKVFILLLLTLSLFGANIDNFAKKMGFERDYNKAFIKSKKEDKVLVMILSSDYCPWCRKFEHKTLSSKLIETHLHKKFVTLVVDKKYDSDSFPSKYKTHFTPKVFFINPHNEKILFDTTGYVKQKKFNNVLDKVQKLFKDAK